MTFTERVTRAAERKRACWNSPPIMYPSKEKIDALIYDLASSGIHEDEVEIVRQFIKDAHTEYIKKINRLEKLWKYGVRI